MFSRDALELIQQTAVTAQRPQLLPDDTHTPVVVIDGKIIDLERYQAGRARFRGTYRTSQLSELIAYTLHRFANEPEAKVFVDTAAASATAFFNLGTDAIPGHGDDIGILQLRNTAAYASLLKTINVPLGQRQLSDWLEDWADCLQPNAGYAAGLATAINAVRDITITNTTKQASTVRDLGATRSALEDIEAKSDLTLPSGFIFKCQPYDGFDLREWRLRLSILTDSDKPKLVLRPIAFEDTQEKVAQEFERRVREGLPGIPVFRGQFTP